MTTNQKRATKIIREALAHAWNSGPIFNTREFPEAAAQALADAQPPILMPDLPEPDGAGTYVGTWFRADGTAWLPEHVEDDVASVIDTNTPGYITVRVEGDVLLSIAQDHALDFARKIIAAHNQGADRG